MENLTDNEKHLAIELRIKPATGKKIKERANDNGACIQRADYKRLVDRKIATEDTNEFEVNVLSRGPRWQEFLDKYGYEITERELSILSIIEELGPVFSDIPPGDQR